MNARVITYMILLGLVLLGLTQSHKACATTGPDESKLQPSAIKVAAYVKEHYPEVPRIGGWRHDARGDHPSGRAVDIMIPNWRGEGRALGDRVLHDLLGRAGELNIKYLIWCQTYHPVGGTPRRMANRGSANRNHYNHIHVTVH